MKRNHEEQDATAAAESSPYPPPVAPLTDTRDVLRHTMLFASGDGFLYVAGVSKSWKIAWGERPKETPLRAAVQTVSRLAWAKDAGCALNALTCMHVAAAGCLEALEYARSEGGSLS